MAKDAIYFLVPLGAATAGAFWVGWHAATVGLGLLALFVAYFFRDPRRTIPSEAGIIVSPADGKVVEIQQGEGDTRVSIFLSIFNVHINRSPINGRVTDVEYRAGRFRAAFNPLASVENEQNTLTLEGEGIRMECSQIAGIVARRLVCWSSPGSTLARGERFGLIRFGSRVELVLPPNVEILVQIGDKIHGGSSVIGRIMAEEERKTA
jgi:phosphatidylserine decarboxylase